MNVSRFELNHRLLRAGAHLLISLCLVTVIALVMFFIWFPAPFRSLSGGFQLFLLVSVVDVMLGPCATMVVSSPGKPAKEWQMDIALIVVIQLAALSYGIWTIYQARPVYMAFEVDRFRAIQAVDVPQELLQMAPPGFQALPKMGPGLVAVRAFRNEQERVEATIAALGGVYLGARPDLWTPYQASAREVLAQSKPVEELMARVPSARPLISEALEKAKGELAGISYLPLVGRKGFWTVLIDAHTAMPIAYLPVDPYGP